ncbi:MAG: hypothetical protein K0R24_2305 [Gammaproteobacteria bacterium]|nr:hypothetical protein [Gammaproteobacteria bacterium]
MDETLVKKQKKHFADWLRDAYAMEHQSIELFESEIKRMKDKYPAFSEQISIHLQNTKRQTAQLERCLKDLGEDTSIIKTGVAKVIGTAQALSGLFTSDEVVKASVALYVFEHYKIANYIVLIEAAKETNQPHIIEVCNEILQKEKAMADWMINYIPKATIQFLNQTK